MDDQINEEMKKKQKDKWLNLWFAIEVMATDKDVLEDSIKTHIEKLRTAKNVFVYDIKFHEILEVANPMKDVGKAYSKVVDVKLLIKDIISMVNIVMLYGPSAVEVIGPEKIEIKIDEAQKIANTVAGIMHQFAAAGVGGLIIKPDK